VCASGADIQVLAKEIERNPQLEVTIDVAAGKVFFEDQEIAITLPSTAHEALTSGQWDPIAELLENKDAVHERITALGFA
jgi:3-isopropylmalate/(R)-2-methylmalate dehydratase small subunit